MKRAVLLSMAMLASAASVAEKKTYSYTCKGGNFTVTAVVDSSGAGERWSKADPVILQIGAEPPQTLLADPDAPDADAEKVHHLDPQESRHDREILQRMPAGLEYFQLTRLASLVSRHRPSTSFRKIVSV